jgi:hypothetical protein
MSKSRRHLAFKNEAPAALVIWCNHQEGMWMDFSNFLTELCPVVESFFQLKEVEMRTGELRVTF